MLSAHHKLELVHSESGTLVLLLIDYAICLIMHKTFKEFSEWLLQAAQVWKCTISWLAWRVRNDFLYRWRKKRYTWYTLISSFGFQPLCQVMWVCSMCLSQRKTWTGSCALDPILLIWSSWSTGSLPGTVTMWHPAVEIPAGARLY